MIHIFGKGREANLLKSPQQIIDELRKENVELKEQLAELRMSTGAAAEILLSRKDELNTGPFKWVNLGPNRYWVGIPSPQCDHAGLTINKEGREFIAKCAKCPGEVHCLPWDIEAAMEYEKERGRPIEAGEVRVEEANVGFREPEEDVGGVHSRRVNPPSNAV